MRRLWTDEEDAYLLENYNSMTYSEIGEKLGRSAGSVECRVARLKKIGVKMIRDGEWTKEEERILLEEYSTCESLDSLANRLNKSVNELKNKVQALRRKGIDVRRDNKWTEEEKQLLIKIYQTATKEELEKAIGRTYEAIITQVAKINKTRPEGKKISRTELEWSGEEDQYIFDNFSEMSPKEMATVLNRSAGAIHNRIQELRKMGHGDKLVLKKTKWTQEELDFIVANYDKMTNIEIGKRLGRPNKSVTTKAQELGLKSKKVEWDKHKISIIKSKWNSTGTNVIASELGIPERKLVRRANMLGLTFKSYSKSGSFTAVEVSELIGMSKESILNRIRLGQIKARKLKYGGTYVYRIEMEDLGKFMKEYPQYYDLLKADLESVKILFAKTSTSGLIMGLPEWLEKKIQKDIQPGRKLYGRKEWTLEEVRKAKMLKETGWTHRKIAERLGRSKESVAAMFQSGKYTHLMSI